MENIEDKSASYQVLTIFGVVIESESQKNFYHRA
jgi:hypothetical protein